MLIATFDQAKVERDRILVSPLLDILKGLTISGKGNYDNLSGEGTTVMPIDGRFVFELVVDLNDGGHQTLKTTEDVDLFLMAAKGYDPDRTANEFRRVYPAGLELPRH